MAREARSWTPRLLRSWIDPPAGAV